MNDAKPLEELRHRISQALRDSPVQDIEKNLHALLGAFFDRFDLATREDLDLQKKLLEKSDFVGDRFSDEARAIHLGEAEARAIHGRASRDDARDLIEDGIPVSPLLFPVPEPGEEN